MIRTILAVAIALLVGLSPLGWSADDPVVSSLAADEFVAVEDVSYSGGVVSGILVNRSSARLKNVKLRISASWRWADEFNPGTDDMSWGAEHLVTDVPPGGKVPFRYESPEPVPSRTDGSFHVEVSVASLTRERVLEE